MFRSSKTLNFLAGKLNWFTVCVYECFIGNKCNEIDVVYTMWDNLKKTAGMDVGQVGFHKQKEVINMDLQNHQNIIECLVFKFFFFK